MHKIVRIYRGIYLFGLMVEWLQSPACHVGGTGSNPVGTARKYARFIGIFQAYSKIPPMGVHVPRLAMDLCKVRGRVRFSSSPQVGYKRIFNWYRKFVRQTNEYGILFEMTFRFWRI